MIVDLFAGPGGWSEGLRMLGLTDIGIEWDAAACATRAAAGHRTIWADVATYPLQRFTGRVEGLAMSPPCTTFSAAGKGDGRVQLARLVEAVHAGAWHGVDPTRAAGYGHVLEVGRWVEAVRPRWVVCEQVPEVLPVWRAYAHRWRAAGWSTWAGVLCAADYGVGQTRRRAILIASLDVRVGPPAPTHCYGHALFGALHPWWTMAEALGWPERGTSWPYRMPATTVAGDPRVTARCHHEEGSQGRDAKSTDQVRVGNYEGTEPIRLTLAEAMALQSFRPGYPVQGNQAQRHQQVGNAVPPLLAAHVVAAATGRVLEPPAPEALEAAG